MLQNIHSRILSLPATTLGCFNTPNYRNSPPNHGQELRRDFAACAAASLYDAPQKQSSGAPDSAQVVATRHSKTKSLISHGVY